MDQVALPACAQNRIPVTGLAELEIDQAAENRLAFVCAGGMAIAARGACEDEGQKKHVEQTHDSLHR